MFRRGRPVNVDAILFKIIRTCAMTPKAAILFKIVHTCAKECLILKYKYVQYVQNPWFHPVLAASVFDGSHLGSSLHSVIGKRTEDKR